MGPTPTNPPDDVLVESFAVYLWASPTSPRSGAPSLVLPASGYDDALAIGTDQLKGYRERGWTRAEFTIEKSYRIGPA